MPPSSLCLTTLPSDSAVSPFAGRAPATQQRLAAPALGVLVELLRRKQHLVRELLSAGGLLLLVELLLGGPAPAADAVAAAAAGAGAGAGAGDDEGGDVGGGGGSGGGLNFTERVAAARALMAMVTDSLYGAQIGHGVSRLLTIRFGSHFSTVKVAVLAALHRATTGASDCT